VFQVKFVEEANGAGSDPKPALIKAVRAEASRITQRLKFKTWTAPRHYVLVTNAPVSPITREEIGALLAGAIGDECQIHLLNGSDVCDLLDEHPNVRKSFPQLLGLRDLNELLASVVHADVITKSRFAIELARELAPLIVPTAAYERALRVLAKHNFVVLEGPPEMGKSAIAWMVALVQVSLGWQAIVCDKPDELFANYDSNEHQIFVADDAFGRGEYDVTRASQWERQIERALQLIDATHWLIWTSRKHLLERAKHELDLQGKASRFPDPAEVLVDASELSIREKALILYRHAKATRPTKVQADVVRSFATFAVADKHFTPERIRRLVVERLDELVAKAAKGSGGREAILADVAEAIRRPTERMRISFKHLPLRHKWLLLCVLQAGDWPLVEEVRRAYDETCPPDHVQPFSMTVEELSESFVRQRGSYLLWMHPSYRDVVIGELAQDASLRDAFLRRMTADGFKLALSVSGGATGSVTFPFMVDEHSWDLLETRLREYIPKGSVDEVCELLQVLGAALDVGHDGLSVARLTQSLGTACALAKEQWDSRQVVLDADQLHAFADASARLNPIPPMPGLGPSWDVADARFSSGQDPEHALDADDLEEWSKFIEEVAAAEPRLLAARKFPQEYSDKIDALLNRVTEDVENVPALDSPAEMRSEAARLNSIADTMRRLAKLGGVQSEEAIDLGNRLHAKAEALEDCAIQDDEPEPEVDDDEYGAGEFDVVALFRDL
jgi:hypothetical protein